MFKAFFFDLDGVLFDSMPHHSQAWDEVMKKHQLDFTAQDCYRNEGRTGQDVIYHAILQKEHREASQEEIWAIYKEKTDHFYQLGGAGPIPNVKELLEYLVSQNKILYIVTGSGQQSLFDQIEETFPHVFVRERMVTALDVTKGKPDPEPYLKAWEKAGIDKSQCCVIENAPLGIRSAKAAGLFAIGVNTGPLPDKDLYDEGADLVFPDMKGLLQWLKYEEHSIYY